MGAPQPGSTPQAKLGLVTPGQSWQTDLTVLPLDPSPPALQLSHHWEESSDHTLTQDSLALIWLLQGYLCK